MSIQQYIKNLQQLPEHKKRVIFVAVMAVAVLIVGVFGFFVTKSNIQKIGQSVQSISLPKFDMNLQDSGINLPNVDLNNVSKGDAGIMSQDQTADWKTYTNIKYNFEIKYPSNWSVREGSVNKKFSVNFLGGEPAPFLIIQFHDAEYINFLTEYQKNFEERLKRNIEKPPGEINDIQFAGVAAKEFLYYSPEGFIEQSIVLSKNNQTVEIQSVKGSILDPILATFKFTPVK